MSVLEVGLHGILPATSSAMIPFIDLYITFTCSCVFIDITFHFWKLLDHDVIMSEDIVYYDFNGFSLWKL